MSVASAFPADDPDLPADHMGTDTHRACVGGDQDNLSGQRDFDSHTSHAAEVPTSPPTILRSTPDPTPSAGDQAGTDHLRHDTQGSAVGAVVSPPAESRATPVVVPLADPVLYVLAAVLDDLEHTRKANQNRLRQLTRTEADSDGEERGFGLPLTDRSVASLAGVVDAFARLEHEAVLNLQRRLRKHPLGGWVKATVGIGEKQGARLLAAIGDPYWNTLHDRPRTVSELWAYSGLHVLPASHGSNAAHGSPAGGGPSGDTGHAVTDIQGSSAGVAARRRKGQRSNWSPTAKMRAYLCATSCIKQAASPYRDVYDARRAHTATTHPDWTAGHSHNDALRITAKAILRDLWRAARDIHPDTTEGHPL